MKNARWICVLLPLVAVGCSDVDDEGSVIPVAPGHNEALREADKDPLPSFDPMPKDSNLISGESTAPLEAGVREFGDELRIAIPGNWEEVERTPIQRSVLLAKFRIPDTTVEITISTARGGIDLNFDRWRGQFMDGTEDEDNISFSDSNARLITLTGGFRPGFGRKDESGWMMLGAGLPRRPEDYYIKLTGLQEDVLNVKDEFRKTIKSASFF